MPPLPNVFYYCCPGAQINFHIETNRKRKKRVVGGGELNFEQSSSKTLSFMKRHLCNGVFANTERFSINFSSRWVVCSFIIIVDFPVMHSDTKKRTNM